MTSVTSQVMVVHAEYKKARRPVVKGDKRQEPTGHLASFLQKQTLCLTSYLVGLFFSPVHSYWEG